MMTDLLRAIRISTGFNLQAQMPLDPRLVVQSKSDITTMANILKYPGMSIYCIDDDVQYQLAGNGEWKINHAGFCNGKGAPTPTTGMVGDMYINKDNSDIYLKLITDTTTLSAEWVYVTNIKGAKGDQGIQGVTGTRGTIWLTGTTITGIDPTGNVFPSSGVDSANLNDLYYNTDVCSMYKCVLAGNANTAKWAYIGTTRGEKGDKGDQGIQGIQGLPGAQGIQGVTGDTGAKGEAGTFLNSGPHLKGPTAAAGQVFPDLAGCGDTFAYRDGDFYLSSINGDMYLALTSGLIHEVKWLRLFNAFGYRFNSGILMTGTGLNVIFPDANLTYSNVNDMYLNTNTYHVYICTKEGSNTVATWSYMASLKGAKGDPGERGLDGPIGNSVRMTSDKLLPSTANNVSANLSNTDHLTVHDLVLDKDYNMFEITALSADKSTYTVGVFLGCIRGGGIENATEQIVIPRTGWSEDPIVTGTYQVTVQLKAIQMTKNTDVYIAAAKTQSNLDAIIAHEVYCSTQHVDINSLTFIAASQPTTDITFDLRVVVYYEKEVL